jgi:hypothetical protein
MTRRDIRHRLIGVAILLGAGGSTLLHRQVWLAHASGPATLLEAALALVTFALGSLGLLLVFNGARLRDDWKRDCNRAARRRRLRAKPARHQRDTGTQRHLAAAAAMDPTHFAGGRVALAAFLIMRAHQAALDAKPASKGTVESKKAGDVYS